MRRGRRHVVVAPQQTRQAAVKKGERMGGWGRAGVIVLQNNLNFNYFGELQKRRCDSLTVCHRKINWLLLLPPSPPRFDRVSRAHSLSLSLSFSYTHIAPLFSSIG